jgi:peptidoglycan L-alanyl-D-glutamate endopeptidase CwlK
MSFTLSARDEQRLVGVHPDLVMIVRGAALHYAGPGSFIVVEGLRTIEQQRAYFQAGKSKTMKSRHLTGHAVDLAPKVDLDGDGDLELSWALSDFYPINDAMRASAAALGKSVEWGGSWASFIDAPHFQLSWSKYP